MSFLKNKKFIVCIGIFIIIVVCFFIDFIISNFTSDEIWVGNNQVETQTDDEILEEIVSDKENYNTEIENEAIDSSSEGLNKNDSGFKKIENENNIKESDIKDNIYVYITGEVNKQGVVILKKGSRINDAIDAANGITTNADISKINLVFILEDGMKINIPSYNELKNNPDFEYITMGSGDGESNSWTSFSNNSGSANSKYSYSEQIQVVNINTATQTELETLPGIGPSLALRIINYREENGKFSSIDEIKNVSGIGDSRFNDIKDYITV